MATSEYNPEQSGMRSELDEPRRTTESTGLGSREDGVGGGAGDDSGLGVDSTSGVGGGAGDDSGLGVNAVNEDEPPRHKIHSEDEPLPKPSGDDEQFSTPTGNGAGGNYGDDTMGEKYQDSRSEEPQTETPETQDRGFGGDEKPSGGYSDPSAAFPGAPVDRTMEQPGYGQDTGAPEPMSTGTEPMSPTPKKEGFVQKLKDKLPGHKTSTPTDTMDDETPSPTGSGTPKKGLVAKIKEKLPGHHSPTAPTTME